jgi:uncharacterized membrane protein YbhN (UPF0104 family)
MKYRALRIGAKTAVGLLLLVWLIASIDARRVGAALRTCDPLWIAAGAAAFIVATLPASIRLQVLFPTLRLPLGWALRLTWGSYFFNQLLPGNVGGDAYRSMRLKGLGGTWGSAIGLLVIERALGALSLLLPAGAYAAARYGRLPIGEHIELHLPHPRAATWYLITILLFLVVGMAVLLLRSHRFSWLWRDARLAARTLSVAAVAGVVGLSILNHTLRVLGVAAFLAAVGQGVAFGDLAVVMALTLLASLVPLSLGALGIREGVFVYALAAFHVPPADALTVALLTRLAVILLGLAGSIFFYRDRH